MNARIAFRRTKRHRSRDALVYIIHNAARRRAQYFSKSVGCAPRRISGYYDEYGARLQRSISRGYVDFQSSTYYGIYASVDFA